MTLEDNLKVNYHAYLHDIKDAMDPVIQKMRDQNGQSWRGQAWLGPIKQFGGYMKHLKVVKAIEWGALPIVGPILAGIIADWFTELPLWVIVIGCLLLASIAYFLLVKWYEGRMATIGDPRFHVEAFKAKRPSEYGIWSQFVNKHDFTFGGLTAFVDMAFNRSGDPGPIDRVVAFTTAQVEQMQSSIHVLEQTISEQKEAIISLEDEVELSENAVGYLVGLIKKITENLYRLINDKLSLHDMDFVTGFSLYRKEGNELRLILDKGTSGAGPHTLDLMNPVTNYAAIDAANNDINLKAFRHNPYPGRYVVAFRMNMLLDQVWVWCFHFDEDDERGLSLTLSNDIIESRQIRRLIHVFCLVLQKQMISREEVDQHAANE